MEELVEKFEKWKKGLEENLNAAKSKVMIGSIKAKFNIVVKSGLAEFWNGLVGTQVFVKLVSTGHKRSVVVLQEG